MRHHRRIAVVVLALAAGTASAQGRKTQVVTGASLASLGVYAAVMAGTAASTRRPHWWTAGASGGPRARG